jgi:hypothetical protein
MKKAVCLFLIIILGMGLIACTSMISGPGTNTTPETTTKIIIETPQNLAPPIVRISDNDYSMKDLVSFMRLAEDSELVRQSIPNPQAYVDSAINKADELKLNSENGVAWTFMLSNKTAQLPYLIEKAKYQGREAWLITLNWEMNDEEGNRTHGSHVAVIALKYGTDTVLVAMSCG